MGETMSSRIEQLIDEIEDYIDNCKYQPLSNSKIIVNKEEIDELLRELKNTTPKELVRYQKVVSNQQEILKEAKEKAQSLIDEAAARTNEMISQNAIMQQAYAQADEVVKTAYSQAQEILTTATLEANAVKSAAVEYMDNMLSAYENVVSQTMRVAQSHYESFYTQLNQYHEIAVSNRNEINPPTIDDTAELPTDFEMQDTGAILVPEDTTGNIPVVNNVTSAAAAADPNGDLKLDLLS